MNYVPTKSMVQFSDASFVVYLLTEGKVKGRFRWPIDNRSKMIVFFPLPHLLHSNKHAPPKEPLLTPFATEFLPRRSSGEGLNEEKCLCIRAHPGHK